MSSNSPKRRARRDALNTQFLGFVEYARCRECGMRVKWKIRTSKLNADKSFRIEYLYCPTPGCDGRATRLVDVQDSEF